MSSSTGRGLDRLHDRTGPGLAPPEDLRLRRVGEDACTSRSTAEARATVSKFPEVEHSQ